MRHPWILPLSLILCLLVFAVPARSMPQVLTADGGCQFLSSPSATAAFCDTFDAPSGTGNRSGDLNGDVWGVSRLRTETSYSQSNPDNWSQAVLQTCSMTQTVTPDADLQTCNGQVRDAVNDFGSQTVLAMYPKQPFDISGLGRTGTAPFTGTAVFDVSDNSQGIHGAWPEWWYTDQPVPAPHDPSLSTFDTTPRNGLGISFANLQSGPAGVCPGKAYPPSNQITVDRITTVTGYVSGAATVVKKGCMTRAGGPDQLNHVEIRVSTSAVDVYGTDAGTLSPLRWLAHAAITLPFTRGLTWMEDVHYNANKDCPFPCQRNNTFAWDNFGFDGPVLDKDLTFDVLEPKAPHADGSVDLGWSITTATRVLTTTAVSGVANAGGAAILLNLAGQCAPTPPTLTYSLNGSVQHTVPWPFPDTDDCNWRTAAIPASLSEVLPGPNTIALTSTTGVLAANVDLLLIGAGGGGPTATPTAAATSTDTATPISTATPVPTDTGTDTPVPTDTATATPADTSTATDTQTPIPTDTGTATATASETATDTPEDTDTATATETPTGTATDTDTPVPTATATNSPTVTPTDTATPLTCTEEVIHRSPLGVVTFDQTFPYPC